MGVAGLLLRLPLSSFPTAKSETEPTSRSGNAPNAPIFLLVMELYKIIAFQASNKSLIVTRVVLAAMVGGPTKPGDT